MTADDEPRTDVPVSGGTAQEVTVVHSDAQPSSEAPAASDEGGSLHVMTTNENSSVMIYYDAAIIERRRSIFRLNRGLVATEGSTSE